MLTKILNMSVNDFVIKDGDIKVDANEMRHLLIVVQGYHNILCSMLERLDVGDKSFLDTGLDYTEYFQNKYIVLGELRRKQKQWFDILKKFEDKSFTAQGTAEEIDGLRRNVWGIYLEEKSKREALQREVDEIKNKKYNFDS